MRFVWMFAYFLATCVIGARQRGLARGLHEATHGCFASNQYLNFFLGTFCSGYVVFQSFCGYQASHVRNHHPYLGTDRDPDYQGLKENGICGVHRTRAHVERYLLSLLWPIASLKYFMYLIKYRIWTKDDDNRETLLRSVYLIMLTTIFLYSGRSSLLLFYWIIPYFTTHMWIGSLIELMEHYPMIETAPRIDIYLTRNRFCGWLWNFFLGVHNESYHLVNLNIGFVSYNPFGNHKYSDKSRLLMKALWFFLALLLIILYPGTSNAWDCYETWSRCTGWSSPATGILWQSCPSYCQGCKNAATGYCVQVGTTTCNGKSVTAFQCQCSGRWTGSNKPSCYPAGLG
ncbi:unnamed protein product [Rotaria socialis]|uniref:Fatty acid desaturase domain-containing protein n=2 Tax=Rotaria socialis TaxID=392032 RepID=A0A817T5R8_9BILA|nr:unnamed protein product [Rotaria socialis]